MIWSGPSVAGASKSNWWVTSTVDSVGTDKPVVVGSETTTVAVVVVVDAGVVVEVVVVEGAGNVELVVSSVVVSTAAGDTVAGIVDAVSSSPLHAATTSKAPHRTVTRRHERHAARSRTVRDMVESA
jgi:hypothetical protein